MIRTRVDDHAVTGVNADVANAHEVAFAAAVGIRPEHKVARLELTFGEGTGCIGVFRLHAGGSREADADLTVHPAGKTGAVKFVRTLRGADIGTADFAARNRNNLLTDAAVVARRCCSVVLLVGCRLFAGRLACFLCSS